MAGREPAGRAWGRQVSQALLSRGFDALRHQQGAPGLLLGAGLAFLLLKVFPFDEVSTRFVIAAALGGGCLIGGLLTAIPRAKAARQTAQEVFLTAKLSRYSLSGAVQRLLLRLEAKPELATLARNAVAKVEVHRR